MITFIRIRNPQMYQVLRDEVKAKNRSLKLIN